MKKPQLFVQVVSFHREISTFFFQDMTNRKQVEWKIKNASKTVNKRNQHIIEALNKKAYYFQ